MKTTLDTKILYLSFHNSIKKVFGVNQVIPRKEIITKLGRQFLVPANLRIAALKELEDMKLIERVDRDNVKILEPKLDLELDANKFFKALHLFLAMCVAK